MSDNPTELVADALGPTGAAMTTGQSKPCCEHPPAMHDFVTGLCKSCDCGGLWQDLDDEQEQP